MRISDWSSDVCSSDLPQTFSSSFEHGGIVLFDMQDTNVKLAMFIAMDDPEHGAQRKTVAPAFGPSEISEHAVALRERTARLLGRRADERSVGKEGGSTCRTR